jgi:outer membrane receptor protein involved in Fe transport
VRPGTKYLPRWNQLDLNLSKEIPVQGRRLIAQVGLFNLLNSSAVLTEVQTFGSDLGRVQRFLQGRTMRLGLQFRF